MFSFLSDCHKVEELAGKIYQLLAAERSYQPEVRQVFQKLSSEEASHAQHLDLARQASPKDIDAVPSVSRDKLNAAIKLAEEIFVRVDRGRLSEEEALRLAVRMEEEFMKVHIHNSIYFHNAALAELFEKLRLEDQHHVEHLNECIRWWVKSSNEKKTAS